MAKISASMTVELIWQMFISVIASETSCPDNVYYKAYFINVKETSKSLSFSLSACVYNWNHDK